MKRMKCVLYCVALLLACAAAVPAPRARAAAVALDQPQMQAARADLQKARADLLSATADKGGHRAKALEYVNAAIAEVAAGIRFDRRHDDEDAASPGVTTLSAPTFAVDQPRMQAALGHLRDARAHLDAATTDKGGHRVKAIEYTDKAIDEVNRGIEYDRTH